MGTEEKDKKKEPETGSIFDNPEAKKEKIDNLNGGDEAKIPAPSASPEPPAAVKAVIPEPGVPPTTLGLVSGKEKEGLVAIEMDVDTETWMLDVIEKRQANKKKLIQIAIRQTNEEDWVLQSGKPYLEITGAEKIAPIFSVRVKNIRYEREEGQDEEGKYIRLWYYGSGEIAPNGRSVYSLEELFGSSSTRDDFFGKFKDGKYKPISQIDIRDLRYKAYSDLMRVAVVRLLGLRSVTLEELSAAGLDTKKVTDVKRGVVVTPEDAKRHEEFQQIVKRIVGTDAVKVRELTKKLTIWKNNSGVEIFKENITELTGKSLEIALDKARREAENFDRQNGG